MVHNLPSVGLDVSRRDFLKLTSLGLFGMLVTPFYKLSTDAISQQGRVIDPRVNLYHQPSFKSQEVKVLWKDTVLPITDVVVGDQEPIHNRIWYELAGQGYAHSGSIQPVQTILNSPRHQIPSQGILAEVTVPFTDAHWGPGKEQPFAYRFYYQTTYWVVDFVQDTNGDPWYAILDDKWDFLLYVPANHLRLVPNEELLPLSPDIPAEAKRLEVKLVQQLVIAYEWDQPVYMARAATGAEFSNGRYLTPSGRHLTFHKRPSRHMAAGNLAANGYDLPGVPWISYITESGIAFHGTYWHNDYGRPRSHGCINLTSRAAKWIYRWTLPSVPPGEQRIYEDFGTRVDVG
jgi:lipoprotein-anchoring transpeptidase ErfK/SrfK